MGKLTTVAVKAAKSPGSYHDGDGLMLLVKPSGSRSWQVRVQVDGRRRDFGLGSASLVTLAEAREKALVIRKQCKDGIDPIAQRHADRLAQRILPTFERAARDAHDELVAGWSNVKHRADWLSSLERYAFEHIGGIRIDLVDARAVKDLLLPIWLSKPETARRVRQRVKSVIDWAAGNGLRSPLDLSGLTLPKGKRVKKHFAAIRYQDLPAFYRKVASAPETVGRLALMFTILTAARSNETRGATWQEIDREAQEWRLDAERMKARKPHKVPLSAPAIAILDRLALMGNKPDAIVFLSPRGLKMSDMTLSKILRDMGANFTVHGFRSTFKDWASECTDFPDAVSEVALAHSDENKVRAAYRRTTFADMRVELMTKWADFVVGPDNVVEVDFRKSSNG